MIAEQRHWAEIWAIIKSEVSLRNPQCQLWGSFVRGKASFITSEQNCTVTVLNTISWCLHGWIKAVFRVNRSPESGRWVTWCQGNRLSHQYSSSLPDATSALRGQRLNCNERSQRFANYQIFNAYSKTLYLRHINPGDFSLPFLLTTNLRLQTLLHFIVCTSHTPLMTQSSARRPRLSSFVPKIWFRWKGSQECGDYLLNNVLP